MANYIHLTGNDNPTPYTIIYKKQTNNFGGWSYAARPEAEDSKFYELEGEWLYVLKDRAELGSLRTSWLYSGNPNQLVSITDKDSITKSIPMNNLITTRVSDMSNLFYNQLSFNQQIGNWDVSNVTNMSWMFRNSSGTPDQPPSPSSFNQPIGNWDVSNVTNMNYMFYGSSFNQPIGNWDTGEVRYMGFIFGSSSFNKPIGNWDVNNVRNMEGMFVRSLFNQPIGNWSVNNVTDMASMFRDCSIFNQPIGNWSVNNVTDMYSMFRDCSSFNQDLSSWCVSSVYLRASFDIGATSWTLPKPNFNNPPC